MKTKTVRFALFVCFFVFAQNMSAQNVREGYADSTNSLQEFKRRFTEIQNDKNFYKIMPWFNMTVGSSDYYGNYAGSQNTLQEFKRRYSEIKNDDHVKIDEDVFLLLNAQYFGNYAASQNTLQEFKRRYLEIQNDADFAKITKKNAYYFYGSDYYSNYAGSQNTLREFKQRFTEIENDADFGVIADFRKIAREDSPYYDRYYDNYAASYYGSYAGSQNTLQEFKKRYLEIKNDADFGVLAGKDAYIYY